MLDKLMGNRQIILATSKNFETYPVEFYVSQDRTAHGQRRDADVRDAFGM